MKIQNNGSTGSAPLDNTRGPLGPQGLGSNPGGGQSISGVDGDSVEISGISANISYANAADSAQRANRVTELSALYANGNYQVSSANLSGAIVTQALIPGGEQ